MQRLNHTMEEAADKLNVGRTTVWKLMKTGELKSVKIGRKRLIPDSCLQEYQSSLQQLAA